QQSGSRTDIQDRHLRLQAGTAQGEPTVPGTGSEPDDRLEAVGGTAGAIEKAAYPGAAMSLAVVVLQQRGVRRLHGGACHWQRTRANSDTRCPRFPTTRTRTAGGGFRSTHRALNSFLLPAACTCK